MESHQSIRQGHEAFEQLSGGAESFQEEYTYLLPREEFFAKFAAIAAYEVEISLEVASRLLGRDMMADKGIWL